MKDVIKAKNISGIHTYGEWEMKRGVFRISFTVGKDKYGEVSETFMIKEDVLIEALKLSGIKFEAELKRKYKHLKIAGRELIKA